MRYVIDTEELACFSRAHVEMVINVLDRSDEVNEPS